MNVQVRLGSTDLHVPDMVGRGGIKPEMIPGLSAILDVLCILSAAAIVFWLSDTPSRSSPKTFIFASGLVALASVMTMRFAGLYNTVAIRNPLHVMDLSVLAVAAAALMVLGAVQGLGAAASVETGVLAAAVTIAAMLVCAARLFTAEMLRRFQPTGVVTRRAVILNAVPGVRVSPPDVSELQNRFIHVHGVYSLSSFTSSGFEHDVPILGTFEDMIYAGRRGEFDLAILAVPLTRLSEMQQLVDRLCELPIDVELLTKSDHPLPLVQGVERTENGHQFLSIKRRPLSDWGRAGKTVLDYTFAVVALACLMPALMAIALAIRLDSPGPILFRQQRIGFNNRPFEIFKFRTMHHAQAPNGRVKQAQRADPRVTRVGQILRRMSLDELPQLLNVLNGTMSLVGPRPHAIDHDEEFGHLVRGYCVRHKVRPGITGWAQVNGLRGGIDSHEKLEARVAHDVFYAEHWSLTFDLRILMSTVAVVLFQRNAY